MQAYRAALEELKQVQQPIHDRFRQAQRTTAAAALSDGKEMEQTQVCGKPSDYGMAITKPTEPQVEDRQAPKSSTTVLRQARSLFNDFLSSMWQYSNLVPITSWMPEVSHMINQLDMLREKVGGDAEVGDAEEHRSGASAASASRHVFAPAPGALETETPHPECPSHPLKDTAGTGNSGGRQDAAVQAAPLPQSMPAADPSDPMEEDDRREAPCRSADEARQVHSICPAAN